MLAGLARQRPASSDGRVQEKFTELLLKAGLSVAFSIAILWVLYRALRSLLIWWAAQTGRM